MLYFGHRFPKGEKLSPSPSEAHLSGACLEYAERSDSSIEVLFHHVPTILPSPSLTGWTASLGVWPVPVFPSAPPMQVLAIVRSTATVGETETATLSSVFKTFTVTVALTHCTVPVSKTKRPFTNASGRSLA